MRFATSSEHRDFFTKKGYIEFDDLLSEEEADKLKELGRAILGRRLAASPTEVMRKSSLGLFMAGRDVWREEAQIKALFFKSRLSEIASSLFKTVPLRLAYDQWIETGHVHDFPFSHPASLQDVSSFQSLVGGLIIQLSDQPAKAAPSIHLSPLPQKKGSGVYFASRISLALDKLFQLPGQTLYLLAFCPKKTLYILDKKDPHTHLLKKEGYVFGDQLKSPRHPLIFG